MPEPMEREFRDELAESSGAYALTVLWIRLLADLAVSVPLQLSRELGRMPDTRFGFGPTVPGTQGSLSSLSLSVLAQIQASSALSTRCCCAHSPSTIQAAWPHCRHIFCPTIAQNNFTIGGSTAPIFPTPRSLRRSTLTLGAHKTW